MTAQIPMLLALASVAMLSTGYEGAPRPVAEAKPFPSLTFEKSAMQRAIDSAPHRIHAEPQKN